jgi:hypothetical protein
MIDNFALALSHGLIILAAWRLMSRDDLDDDSADPRPAGRKGRGWADLAARSARSAAQSEHQSRPSGGDDA